jgi:hypothetical protein
VRKTLLCLAAAVGLSAAGAQAQAWHTELGIQGGFVRLKPAGTNANDQTDVLFVPGFSLGQAFPTPNALFLIAPIGDKVALEPSLTGGVLNQGATATILQGGLRLDYAVVSGIYAAGGGLVGHLAGSTGTESGYEFGLQLAGGYRFHFSGPIQARLEANAQFWKGAHGVPSFDTYGLLLGLSARL